MSNPASETGAQAIKQVFSILDRVTEFRYCLLLVALALSADIDLSWFNQTNLITFDWSSFRGADFGRLLVALIGFVVYMAILSFLLQRIAEVLVMLVRQSPLGGLFDPPYQSPGMGVVSLFQLRDHAQKSRDTFSMDIYRQAMARWEENDANKEHAARLAFSNVVLILVDVFQPHSIVRWLWNATPDSIGGQVEATLFGAVGVLLLFAWLTRVWNGRAAYVVYYLPLWEEIEEKRRRQRKAEQENYLRSR